MEVSDALPGADLIRRGLSDLEHGLESIPALLVLIGAPRLRRIGFDSDSDFLPEDKLYAKLAEEDSDSANSRPGWQDRSPFVAPAIDPPTLRVAVERFAARG